MAEIAKRDPLSFLIQVLLAGIVGVSIFWLGGVLASAQAAIFTLVAIALLLTLLRTWTAPQGFGLPLAFWMALAFVVYAVWRHFHADTEYASQREVLLILCCLSVFFISMSLIRSSSGFLLILSILIVLAGLASLYALVQYMTGSDQVLWWDRPDQYQGRASGTYINPNHFAGLLILLLPPGITLVLLGRMSHALRIVLGYFVLMMLVGMAVTLSRGGFLAAGISLLVLFVWLWAKRRVNLPTVIGILLVAVVAGSYFARSFYFKVRLQHSEEQLQRYTHDTRFLIWKGGMAVWKEAPMLGVGPNQFRYRFYKYRDPWLQRNPERVHNDYLNTLIDYGIIGFLLAVTIPISIFVPAFRMREQEKTDRGLTLRHSTRAAAQFGIGASLIGLMVHALVDFSLHIPANALAAALVFGAMLGLVRNSSGHSEYPRTQTIITSRLAQVLMLAVAGVLIWQGTVIWREARNLGEVDRSRFLTPENEGRIRKAIEVAPNNPETLMLLGEYYRLLSFEGGEEYRSQSEEALQWYARAHEEMPENPWPVMKMGMCLDWLGRHEEAGRYFDKMIELDPNSQHTKAMMGWHYFQMEDYEKAREWFHRSRNTPHFDNQVTKSYEQILNRIEGSRSQPDI